MKVVPVLRIPRLLCLAFAAGLLAACGDDKPTTPNENPSDTPLYAVITQVNTSDGSQSYVALTDKLDLDAPLALDKAIEVPGRALGSGIPKSRSVYVSSSEGAVVTRYTLTDSGTLKEDGTVSFARQGVSSIGEYQNQFQFVSATKAYYFDGRTAQVILWNPTDMTVIRAIDIRGINVDGATTTFATAPIRLENRIIMPLGWRPSMSVGITPQAGVVVVDTREDTAQVVVDKRCGYARDGVIAPDGKVYLATEAYAAAVYRVSSASAPAPCLLRFDPTTSQFDADFYKELSSLTGGAATGSLLRGPTGSAYLRVLDETLAPVSPTTNPRALASASAWTWWQLDLGALSAKKVSTLPATTGSTFLFDIADNRTLYTEFTNSSSTTNFRELSGQGGKVTATTQGLTFSMLQIR
ncbi:hypothetical protein KRR26_16155 [Corallococcus sp. M34]|uniref:hypothetical protein n=1 Tax=Citreicoccus inhibens TaxID=2849499 RepID=UPI001C235110|nr:hypothetical protein [Citreicoccus inhibens]MBU8897149.1 hypothetical protein [Citreicoccus inhibens]